MSNYIYGLIIETSFYPNYFILTKNNKILSLKYLKKEQLTSTIFHILYDFLKREKVSLEDLKYIAIGLGPGSFTGIRLGASIGFSLSYGKQLPLLTFCFEL